MTLLEEELTPAMLGFLDGLVASGAAQDRGDALRAVMRAVMQLAALEVAVPSRLELPKQRGSGGSGGDVTIQLRDLTLL